MSNLCSSCKHLLRRIFIDPELEDGGTLISRTCLLTQWDLDNSETIDCSHFEAKVENLTERILRWS